LKNFKNKSFLSLVNSWSSS